MCLRMNSELFSLLPAQDLKTQSFCSKSFILSGQNDQTDAHGENTCQIQQAADATMENFADLLAESFAEDTTIEGGVVKGHVVNVTDDYVTIDGLNGWACAFSRIRCPWSGC